MVPFLHKTASDLYERFGNDLGKVRVVFPNRRSILYFRKYLSQIVEKPIWSPECVTISGFIQQFSKLRKANDLILLFELYKAYSEVRKSDEAFDNFYYWGSLMLSDFDDIDKYLVDAQNLFQNLSALKNINELFEYLSKEQVEAIQQFWKEFGESRKSSHHTEFSSLWSSMYAIYQCFKNNIKQKNIAYEGMIYREVADTIVSNEFVDNDNIKTAFIGFNALSECEKTLFKYYKQTEKALFYWDYNPEYISNKIHEAGFFIQNNLKEFPSALDEDYFTQQPKPDKIELISVPSIVGQAKILDQLINESPVLGQDLEKSAILLTDESLLMPVLHSIPDSVEEINITMGFPFDNSPVFTLIESLCRLHTQASKKVVGEMYYFKNVLEIISHPYIQTKNKQAAKAISDAITSKNRNYLDYKELAVNDFYTTIFKPVDNTSALLATIDYLMSKIGNIIREQMQTLGQQPVGVESEALICAISVINQLKEIIQNIDNEISVSLGASVITKALKEQKIAFDGEPLKGIQVMGFLESRALDFENIFILGVNEGNLPKTNIPASFIPYNLRHGFGLPTLEYRDAMYAYYFYRVINRAKNVYLIYSSKAEKMGSTEMSRYAVQLLFDGNYNIVQKTQVFQIKPSECQIIEAEKTQQVLEKLHRYTNSASNKFLSPSALTNYIDCSLRFYYKYIAELKEPEETTAEIDAPMLGSILHRAMQQLYKPYIGQEINTDIIDNYLKNTRLIELQINKAIAIEFIKGIEKPDEYLPEGRNYIIARIVFKYVRKVLETDRKIVPFTIKALEQKVNIETLCAIDDKPVKVKIGGYIDRIDETREGIRIIDYKTGKLDTSFKSIDELFSVENGKKQKKEIFQTILYSIIFKQGINAVGAIVPGIYNVRDMFNDKFDFRFTLNKVPIIDIGSIENEFMLQFDLLLKEILNPSFSFYQTADTKKCTFCAYNAICHR